MLTIFSWPRPFVDPYRGWQNGVLRSWVRLRPLCQVLLAGDAEGVEGAARRFGVEHVGGLRSNERGVPYWDAFFEAAKEHARYPLLAYASTDVVLFQDVLRAAERCRESFPDGPFLMVSRRWDLRAGIGEDVVAGHADWEGDLRDRLPKEQHSPYAVDLFVFPINAWAAWPKLLTCRARCDHWMVWDCRRRGVPVIDASDVATAVHLNHARDPRDPAWREEAAHNRKVAGELGLGGETWGVDSADWRFDMYSGKLEKK